MVEARKLLSLADPYVVSSEGTLNPAYPSGRLLVEAEEGGPSVRVICVAVQEGRVLVAVPHSSWHRTVAQRILAPGTFKKPIAVEVASCQEEDREEMAEAMIKVWMGYFTLDYANLLDEFAIVFDEVDYDFEPSGLLPTADSLKELAMEHFAFFSAEEHQEESVGEDFGSVLLSDRVTRLEDLMNEVNTNLAKLVSQNGEASSSIGARAKIAPARPSALRSPKVKIQPKATVIPPSSREMDFPDLDPSVVAAAMQAGIEASTLEQIATIGQCEQEGSKEFETIQCGAHEQCPFGKRRRRRSRREHRLWFSSWKLRPHAQCPEQVDRHRGAVGEAEEQEGFKARSSLGRCDFPRRYFFLYWPEESGGGKEDTAHGFDGVPGRHLHQHRAVDGRGHPESNTGPRALCSIVLSPVLGGAQELHRGVQSCGPLFVGHSWGDRCFEGWPNSRSESSIKSVTSTDRSVMRRPRLLVAGGGIESGVGATFVKDVVTPTPGHGVRRGAIQQNLRQSLGRNLPIVPSRPGRLCHQKAQPRQAQERCRDAGQGGARQMEETKAEAESKGFTGQSVTDGDFACSGQPAEGLGNSDESKHYVPGSNAATVRVGGLVNSLPRLVLKTKGALRSFLRSIVMKPYSNDPRTSIGDYAQGAARDVWPIPLPYPEVFRRGSHDDQDALKRLVCLEVVALDWLHLGCPSAAPTFLRMGSRLSKKQWVAVRNLRRLSMDGNTPEFVDSSLMGRAAAKFEGLDDTLRNLVLSMVEMHDGLRGYSGDRDEKPEAFEDRWMRCGSLLALHRSPGHYDSEAYHSFKAHVP